MRCRMLVLTLGFLLVVQGADSVARGGDLTPEATVGNAGLMRYWDAELPLQRGDSVAQAYALDGTLYVVTRRKDLHVIDASVGLRRWTRSLSDRSRQVLRPFHLTTGDGREAVLVTHGVGAGIYARESGAALVEIPDMWSMGSAAIGDALSLYVGSSDGFLYSVRWYDPIHRTPIHTWKVFAGGPVTSTPLLMDDVLYFASQGGGVFACAADWNRQLKWSFSCDAAVVADLYGDESGIYVASLDRSLYRLDVTTGALRWRHRFPQPLRDAPVVSQRTVYQYCHGVGLYAIDVDTEDARKPLWMLPSATAFVSRRADRTCVLMENQSIAVLDSASGEVLGAMPVPRGSVVAHNPDGLTFHVVTPGGQMMCYTSDDVRHLRTDDLPGGGLTPPGKVESGGDADETDADAAEDDVDAAEVDLDDPLRSRSDR